MCTTSNVFIQTGSPCIVLPPAKLANWQLDAG